MAVFWLRWTGLCTLTQPSLFQLPLGTWHKAQNQLTQCTGCMDMLSFSALCQWPLPSLPPVFHSWPVSVTQSTNDTLCFPTHCHGIFCPQL